MTTIFQEKNKKQTPLLITFLILLIITFIVLSKNDQEQEKLISSDIRLTAEKVEIDFNFLKTVKGLNFDDFAPIQEYDGPRGRSNAFLPSELLPSEPTEEDLVE